MKMLVPLLVCLSAVLQATHGQTILDIVKSEGLKTLATALEKANLTDIFSQGGSLTLFAPSDEAFAKLPPGALDAILADPQELKDTLTYHAVQGAMTSNLIVNNMQAETLLPKEKIILDFENGVLRINRRIKVTKADVEASNGVVHVIDSVLIPQRTRPTSVGGSSSGGPGLMDLVVKNELNSVMALAQQSGLFHQLNSDGPYTLLAPNDQAQFASGDMATLGRVMTDPKLVANLLKFHVIPGIVKSSDIKDGQSVQTLNGLNIVFKRDTQGDIFVNGAKVLSPDIEANNGVMHIIDTILEPGNLRNPGEAPSAVSPSTTKQGLMDVVAENNLPSLMVMAQQSGLFQQLNSEGPYTLFAPKEDNNFGGMDPAKIGEIMSDPQKIANLLKFHVIPGVVKSSDIKDGQTVTTLNGEDLVFSVSTEGVTVNGVKVLKTDIIAGNGVIHVIDNLLVPKSEGSSGNTPGSVSPSPPRGGLMDAVVENNLPSLMVLAQQSGLFHQLNTEGPYTLFAPKEDNNFGGMDPAKIGEIMSDPKAMANLLKFHVIPGVVKSSDIKDGKTVTTLNGQDLVFSVNAEGVSVNGVKVLNTDIAAGNGIIHVIDNILLPKSEGSSLDDLMDTLIANNFENFALLLKASDLTDALVRGGPYAVFAPTNAAMEAWKSKDEIRTFLRNRTQLTDLLSYHVTEPINGYNFTQDLTFGTLLGSNHKLRSNVYQREGKGDGIFTFITIDGVPISRLDIKASNGVIHVIDGVLTPPTQNVSDIIEEETNLQTLSSAIKTVGLDTLLSSNGNFTFFAPTDAAFDKLPANELSNLLKDKTKLEALLKNHILPTVVYKSGHQVNVKQSLGLDDLFLNAAIDVIPASVTNYKVNANIEQFDLKAKNGVVHKIDTVIQ